MTASERSSAINSDNEGAVAKPANANAGKKKLTPDRIVWTQKDTRSVLEAVIAILFLFSEIGASHLNLSLVVTSLTSLFTSLEVSKWSLK